MDVILHVSSTNLDLLQNETHTENHPAGNTNQYVTGTFQQLMYWDIQSDDGSLIF